MGDGVLVYFGYPQAHEDDAERAVRAGLGVIDAVGRLDVKSVELQARVGIATGLVVVGDLIGEGSAQEQSVVGETPNLAARLQALAEPDAVVIAASTRRLIGDLFEYRDLGAVEVKGIAGAGAGLAGARPSAVASRFEALRGSALSPLVGRDEEIDLLLRRWARAKAGDGQVVLVSGEPGIGKSRLAAALAERLQAKGIRGCAISARPITRTARFIRSSTSSDEHRGSRPTICPRSSWRSSRVAGPRRAAGRGCGIPRRSAVVAGFGAPPVAEPQPAEEKGTDAGGADPAARRLGSPAAGGDGVRGLHIGSIRPRASSSISPLSGYAACRCC